MNTNQITREAGDTFLIIRASYVRICNGNVTAAALIHIFEQWHQTKIKSIEQNRKATENYRYAEGSETLLQWHTMEELENYMMGIAKRDSILIARRQLVSMGIITEHRNPNPRYSFDKTTYYLFFPEVVDSLVQLKSEAPVTATNQPMEENLHGVKGDQQSTYTPALESDIDSTEKTAEPKGTAGSVRPTEKKSGGKKRRGPGAEPDLDWQRWIDRYDQHVRKHNNDVGHHWSGAQLGALKGLRKHLVTVATPIEGGSTDDQGFKAWCYILDFWDKLNDPFLQKQFDLTVILKKITDIINRLKNGTTNRGSTANGGGKPGHSERREQALREY